MKRLTLIRGASCLTLTALLLFAAACSGNAPATAPTDRSDAVEDIQTAMLFDAEFSTISEWPQSADADDLALPIEREETISDVPQIMEQPSLLPETATQPIPTQPTTTTAPSSTAHVHAYQTTIVQPTCSEMGYKYMKCACGDEQTSDYTPSLGHDFGEPVVTKAATCNETGVKTKTCSRCGMQLTDTIPKLEHQMTDYVVTKEATPTEKGRKTRTCTLCGTEESIDIPKVRPYASMEAALELLQLVNEARAQNGVDPLTFNYTYYPCAEIRANEIGVNYSHTRPNGKTCFTVLEDQGFTINGACGENIFNPHGDDVPVSKAHTAFMDSKGHRENILNPKYKSASICVLYTEERTFFVEMFFGWT